MKIPVQWLKQYVDIPVDKDELANKLTMAGLEVVDVLQEDGGSVFDIEVTSNRPDLLSLLGVAREVSALFDKNLKMPSNEKLSKSEDSLSLEVKVEDYEKCPFYSARILKNIEVKENLQPYKSRISAVGVSEVNNIVDITNFCLFETGQPLHAFDYDKIKGKQITVRRAKEGEKIETIDDEIVELTSEDLVIADKERPIAIAGIIGGKNTEITEDTDNIVLESAYFDPVSIRRTGRRLGLSTESSYRFERGVKVDMIEYTSSRASNLILNSSGGQVGNYERKSEDSNLPSPPGTIELRTEKVEDYLDIDIEDEKIINILEKLDVKSEIVNGAIKAQPPSFRQDLKRDVDLIEEVVRIYGYDRIPAKVPLPTEEELLSKATKDFTYDKNSIIRNTLVNLGLNEIMSYTLISREELGKVKYAVDDCISIKNPLTQHQEILRPSMISSILKTIGFNVKRDVGGLRLFEVGKTYHLGKENYPEEHGEIIIAMYNPPERKQENLGDLFFDLKGIIEVFLDNLGYSAVEFQPEKSSSIYYPNVCAEIKLEDMTIGKTGYILEEICSDFNIPDKVAIAQLKLDSIRDKMQPEEKQYSPISKYPASYRDISVIIDKDIYHSQVENILSTGENVSKVNFIDQYEGKQIPSGKKSLTYRVIYQSQEKTLNDKEVDQSYNQSVKKLKDKLDVQLR